MDLPNSRPVKPDTAPDHTDDSEQCLLKALDAIADEACRVKDHWVKDTDLTRDLDLYRGKLKGNADDRYFDCNFVGAFIDRMVAQLTDNRPIIRLENRKAGISKVARSVEKVIQCVWDESKVQRGLFKLANNAAVNRSAGLYTGFDTDLNTPNVELLRIGQVLIDPNVVESGQVDSAEYVRIERVMTLSEIRAKFPGRGALVKSDVNVSTIGQEPKKRTSMLDAFRQTTVSKDTIPRARVYEWFIQDRQTADDGTRLFPSYRRIICSDDVVLWDGPNPFWDGRIPVDWFDWMVDPEHIWGHSESARLRKMQLAFNQLIDGLVENQLLTNIISVVGDADALPPEQWKKLQNIKSSLLLQKKNRNSTLTVTPPAPFGQDKIQIARSIFTYAQLLTGVTDVTLGDAPGSLQSGLAIEGLQEGANLMTRARASRLEDLMARVGQKLIARVFQFVTSDRVFTMVGPTAEAVAYAMARAELFVDDAGQPMTPAAQREALRFMRFSVLPGSSAPGSRLARARMMAELVKLGAASRRDVLLAADFQD
ncbi:MAG: hypothetical protein KA170_17515, partial [Candidatus Promineofilum sp.]|nr:hypothetical protein [Promineifilum sp.]